MSEKYLTLESLAVLGFDRCRDELGREAVGFKFQTLYLLASASVNRYFQPAVFLSGVVNSGRTVGLVECHIPPNLELPTEAAAWVTYMLKDDRSGLGPLPAWFLEGERHWSLVPPAQEEMTARKRLQAYRSCPRCYIDREYARPLRRKLQAVLSEVDGDAEATFSFDGRVLAISLCGALYEVIASGEGWHRNYHVGLSNKAALPARFRSSRVTVTVFEGNLSLDGQLLGPCEAAE